MAQGRISYGREFHNTDSNYNLPHDEEEMDRLNMQHEAIKLVIGSNCPILGLRDHPPKSILDLCCGSGIWVKEMGEEFPDSNSIGLDLSIPNLPKSMTIPANCQFIAGDVTKPLPFPDESFDLVQMRITPSVFNRMSILREIGRILKTGGYVTFGEPDGSFSRIHGGQPPTMTKVDTTIGKLPHSAIPEDQTEYVKYNLPSRKTWSFGPILEDMIRAADNSEGRKLFTDSGHKYYEMPIGKWSSDATQQHVGELLTAIQIALLDGFRPAWLEHKVMTEAEYGSFRAEVAEVVADPSLELVAPYWYAWGKKLEAIPPQKSRLT